MSELPSLFFHIWTATVVILFITEFKLLFAVIRHLKRNLFFIIRDDVGTVTSRLHKHFYFTG